MVDPRLTRLSKEKEIFSEGCLSIPYAAGGVEAPVSACLTGILLDLEGKWVDRWDQEVVTGDDARLSSHETKHLDGRLLCVERVYPGPLYYLPPEHKPWYSRYIRGLDAGGYEPEVMPYTQLAATLNGDPQADLRHYYLPVSV